MLAVVLVGHGVPASDCPPALIGELMGLQWGAGGGHDHGGGSGKIAERIAQLDGKIRDWPRHAGNDPYKEGLERLAAVLRPMLPAGLFAIGYNEFCRPSVPEVLEQVIRQGATRVLVISSMVTPGGVHSEKDIPAAVERVRQAHPQVSIRYLWPFDLKQVASLFAAEIRRGCESHAPKA